MTKAMRDRFEKRYGCTVEQAAATPEIFARSVSLKARDHDLDIGRGHVRFGETVDAEKLDRESLQILRNW
jgi:hypothetical protein